MEEEIRWRINWLVAVLGIDQEAGARKQLAQSLSALLP